MLDIVERPLRVQIVEDERIIALDLRSGLEQLGFDVVGIAANEPDALRLAEAATPDLVLMDIHLDQGGDGIQAAREIRERLAVPVVFLTAYGEPETLRRAADAAPYGYLLKPFELRELNATVRMAMARRREEIKTERAERRLLLALESAQLAVLELDARPIEEAGPEAPLRWSGHGLGSALAPLGEALSLQTLRERLEPPARQALDELLLHGRPMDLTCRWQVDGAPRWIEIHARRFESEGLVMGMLRDVSERVQSELRLRQAQVVFDATDEAILFLDAEQRVLSCNPAFSALTGWSEAEVLGRKPESFLYARRRGDHPCGPLGEARQGEVTCMRRDGSTFPALEHLCAVCDESGRAGHHVLSFSDISEIRDTQFRLQHLALHDPLTGLGNRLSLAQALQAAGPQLQSQGLALVFIDLDGFKTINDTLGHECGDELLRVMAARLQALLRREDMAVRLGGDEFVVLMARPGQVSNALLLAQKLLDAIAQPVPLVPQIVCVTASAGVALWPEHVEQPEALLKAADAAMYVAKSRGRNRAAAYDRSQTEQADEQLRIEQGLRQALQRQQLALHWQPVVEMSSGRILGAEALLRWEHPQLGAVAPNRFIPLAESTGLIVPMGAWVLEQACAQAAAWHAAGLGELRVAVNVSVRQFEQADVVELVGGLLARHALPPGCLEVEVTESLFANAMALRHLLDGLRALGVRVALDDFGTGYSSLAQLRTLPLDRLKIDRSFVADLERDDNSRAIVQTIITLARSLRLALTAEGVETEAQRRWLLAMGAGEAQGWLFHRALPAERLEALLRAQQRAAP